MRDEVVGITTPPAGLGPRTASDLAGRRRIRALETVDAVAGNDDAADALCRLEARRLTPPLRTRRTPRESARACGPARWCRRPDAIAQRSGAQAHGCSYALAVASSGRRCYPVDTTPKAL